MKLNERGSVLGKVISLVLWIVVLAWVGLVAFDFYNVQQEKEPMFCIEKGTTTYSDGTVDWCKGVGYVVYHYNRTGFNYKYEFGPFWTKDRTADTE